MKLNSLFLIKNYLVLIVFLNISNAWGDHPNEGSIIISQLISDAEKNNLEISQIKENIKSLEFKKNSLYGQFWPHLSLEGGPQKNRIESIQTEGSSIYAKIDWNIYNGGQDYSEIQLHSQLIEIEKRKLIFSQSKIRNEVSKVYFELQFLLESVSLKEKALDLNSQQMKIAKSKNNSGLTSQSDVIEFDLRESTLRSDLVLLNQQLKQKNKDLNLLISNSETQNLIKVKGHLNRENIKFNRSELISKLVKANEELLQSQADELQIDLQSRQTLSNFFPKLDFEARYGRLANEETVFNENDNYFVSLKINIPLFSGLKDQQMLKSLHSKKVISQWANEQKRIQVIAELDKILSETEALNERLDIEEKNLERSEKYYQLTVSDYRRGIKNSPDMVNATERLLDTRIRNLEYRRDLKLALAKIKELTGE